LAYQELPHLENRNDTNRRGGFPTLFNPHLLITATVPKAILQDLVC
jgi:hypothetical protein